MSLKLFDQNKDPVCAKRYDFILKEINEYTGHKSEKNVHILDVGCGRGELAGFLAKFNYQILGVDIYQPKIDEAKKLYPFGNVTFECQDALNLDLKNKFDIIVASDVIEHLKKPEKFVVTANSLLKPDGIFIITIPNGYGIKELTHRMYKRYVLNTFLHRFFRYIRRRLIGDDEWAVPEVDTLSAVKFPHVQFFSFKQLNKLLKNGGFYVKGQRNGSFISSIYMLRALFDSILILKKLDILFADALPHFLASSWFIVAKKKNI